MNFKLIGAIRALAFLCLLPTSALAADGSGLGNWTGTMNLGHQVFTDGHFTADGVEDDGPFLEFAAYRRLTGSVFIGGSLGTGGTTEAGFGDAVSLAPLEVNLKYASAPLRNLVVGFGGGFSYSYAELENDGFVGQGGTPSRSDWVGGGQLFADIALKVSWFTIGLNGKYQLTEEFGDEGVDLSNYRLGLHIGFTV